MRPLLLLLALAPGLRAEEGPRAQQPVLLLPADVSTSTAQSPSTPAASPGPAASISISTPAIAVPAAAVAVATAARAIALPAVAVSTPAVAVGAPAVAVSTPAVIAAFAVSTATAPPKAVSASSATAVRIPEVSYGTPLDPNRGPWLVGEVAIAGNKDVSSYAILERLRARRGSLYTPSDLATDVKEALSVPGVLGARAEVYGMAEEAVPDAYSSITVSTMMARIVIKVEEKRSLIGLPARTSGVSTSSSTAKYPPAAISGALLTPTAYRGTGRNNTPGLGLDINAAYYIGRLYGKNSVDAHATNYIDRIGLWFLTADGKVQLQSETAWRPAMAVGGQGTFMLRDAPQPSLQASNNVTVSVSQSTTKVFSGGYFVASKNILGLRTSLGFMLGNAGQEVAYLTEFLSPQALQFLYLKGEGIQPTSNSTFFGSLILLPSAAHPLAVEFIKPNGMVLNPILFNFKIGYFLKFNFDVAYLRFQGGYDLLGLIQFRFNQFPRF